MIFRQAVWSEPLIFEIGFDGRVGFTPPHLDEEIIRVVGEFKLPEEVPEGSLLTCHHSARLKL